MKPRFWLAMVCWALVCLVLGLIQQAGLYHSSQVSGSSQWLDREPASGSPTASVVESTQFDPARAGPLTSLVLEDSWSKGNSGPPGQETHGPPEDDRKLAVAGQKPKFKTTTSHLAPRNFGLSRRNLKNQGFCNTL
jgi:hypothetical protein